MNNQHFIPELKIGDAYFRRGDDIGVIWVPVCFREIPYKIKISTSNIGKKMASGAYIGIDEGHDDNSNLSAAVNWSGLDWGDFTRTIIECSGADKLLNRLERRA